MHIALSTDIWISIATQAYITVTVNFILPNQEMNMFLLQMMYFPENHTLLKIFQRS